MRGFNYHMLCAFLSLGTLSLKAAKIDFARDIRPVFPEACYNCHGPDAKARKAGGGKGKKGKKNKKG